MRIDDPFLNLVWRPPATTLEIDLIRIILACDRVSVSIRQVQLLRMSLGDGRNGFMYSKVILVVNKMKSEE